MTDRIEDEQKIARVLLESGRRSPDGAPPPPLARRGPRGPHEDVMPDPAEGLPNPAHVSASAGGRTRRLACSVSNETDTRTTGRSVGSD